MLFAVLVLAAVAVVLAAALARARSQAARLTDELAEARQAREVAETAVRISEASAAAAVKERDDALERASRARRDAAAVAKRMQEEAEGRAAAEAERRSVLEDRARLEEELVAAEEAAAAGGASRLAELWSLALAGVRRTWEVSVCPSPGMPSPLDDTDDELRTALEIEVDAAREEAGAAIELIWHGDDVASVAVSVRALSIARELIARLAKVADRAALVVESSAGVVTLTVEAVDVAGSDVVPRDVAPAYRVGPGRYVVGRTG